MKSLHLTLTRPRNLLGDNTITAPGQPAWPFDASLVTDLDRLAEDLRGQADPNAEPQVSPPATLSAV